MWARARDQSGQYASGVTVYLHVIDPADTAAYMNIVGSNLAHTNDNTGPAAILTGTAISAVPNTAGVYQGVTDAGGELDFTLNLQPGTAAGDNYQIEGSFDPTFPSGSSWHSGTLTAWKRVLVDKHNMLRNGVRFVANAFTGATEIHVADNHYGGNMGTRKTIAAGDHIVLVHSPDLDRSNGLDGWYAELHNVADVSQVAANNYLLKLGTKQGKSIVSEQIQRPSYRVQIIPGSASPDVTGDGIAYTTSALTLSSSDYFDSDDSLLAQYDANGNPTSGFPQAFVEYDILPSLGPFVPVAHILQSQNDVLQRFANRWSPSVDSSGTDRPNHQLLVIGDADATYDKFTPPQQAGQTTHGVSNQIASFSYRGAIEWLVKNDPTFSGQNADNWTAKNEFHELAHQWHVDENPPWPGTDGYHCPTTTLVFDSGSVYCVEADQGSGVNQQKSNMIARFHMVQVGTGVWDSEYTTVRQRPDPFVP